MMGYGPEDKNAVLELTYNYGVTDYDKGNGYAQVEIFVLSLHFNVEKIFFCLQNVTACSIFCDSTLNLYFLYTETS